MSKDPTWDELKAKLAESDAADEAKAASELRPSEAKKGQRMNIDEMTVGQLREVAKLARGLGSDCAPKTKAKLEEKRVILVVDRGWIFAGDQTTTSDGYVRLTNAVHVFRWESMGFAAMVAQGKGPKVDLRPVADVEIPKDSIIFRVPVSEKWGL